MPGIRWLHLLLIIVSSGSLLDAGASQIAVTAGFQTTPALTINNIGPGVVAIDGDWQFHLGDDMHWIDPAYDDSQWEHIKADKTWGEQSHPGYTGFAWYRRRLDIAPSITGKQKLAILMPFVDVAYEVYWNGEKIGNLGKLPPGAVWYYLRQKSFALPSSLSGATQGLLAIRVWSTPLGSNSVETSGGLFAPPLIGDAAVIAAKVGQADFLNLNASLFSRALSFFFLLIGTVSFFAWLRDRERKLYLWFAIWLLAQVAYFNLNSTHMMEWFSLPILSGSRTVMLSVADCSLFLLLLDLFDLQDDRRLLRWTWAAIAVTLGFGLADAVVGLDRADGGLIFQWLDAVLIAVWTLSQLFVFVLVYQGLKRKPDLPRILVAVMAFLLYLYDFLRVASTQGTRFTHWGLHENMIRPMFHFAGAGVTSGQTLQTLLLISLANALIRYGMEQRKREEAMELELRSAREVQQVMIPEVLPEVAGYAIQSVYEPAQEVGGDFFQIIPLADESTLVVLGDVSGKGLKAAMNVALIVGTVRTLAEHDSDPAAVLTGLNRRLVGRMQGGFATTIVLKLGTSGDCVLSNAGHLPPFLNLGEMALDPSLPLGIDPDADYLDRPVVLNNDDHLTLYTDGVLEATNSAGELYGFERVTALLADHPDAEFIANTARVFGQEDDITVLTITRHRVNGTVQATSVSVAA